MTVPKPDTITVLVPFSKEEVLVPHDIWDSCRLIEDRMALYACAVLVAVFIVGTAIAGLMQGAAVGFVVGCISTA